MVNKVKGSRPALQYFGYDLLAVERYDRVLSVRVLKEISIPMVDDGEEGDAFFIHE